MKVQETSLEAAESIEPTKENLRALVYATLKIRDMTDEEIQDVTGMNPSTERPRRGELCESGHVIDSGIRRATRSGRKAIVWRAV